MRNVQQEVWKNIPGFSGTYQISNIGRVKSFYGSEHILKLSNNKCGYPKVRLNGKTYLVHRLVALTFIPNLDGKPEVDHINTIRTDNRVENLRWSTRKENTNNPVSLSHYKKMTQVYKLNAGKRKAVVQLFGDKIIAEYCGLREAERATGVSHSNIQSAIKGKFSHAGGFQWKYKN